MLSRIPLPSRHYLRPRSVFFDDKGMVFCWIIHYLYDKADGIPLDDHAIKSQLQDGTSLGDGLVSTYKIIPERVDTQSDHFSMDSPSYYEEAKYFDFWSI